MLSGKKVAAEAAIKSFLKKNTLIGIGSGTTIVHLVDCLANEVKKNSLNVICIPTSFQAKQLIFQHKLPLGSLEEHEELDIAFDGADEITPKSCLIKGGGGCLLQEKIVSYSAKQFIVVADSSKLSDKLGSAWKKGVPIEVIPFAHKVVKNKIENKFGGNAKLRQAVNKLGPVVTDNGNFILDWEFDTSKDIDWQKTDVELHLIPGVLETGLFLNMTTAAVIGQDDGQVQTLQFE